MDARKIAVVSSFLPRQCGIATFSADLIKNVSQAAGRSFSPTVVAMEGANRLKYGEMVGITVGKEIEKEYLDAADYINSSDVNAVSLQHEFGLYGGDGGSYINLLLSRVSAPIITTLHTVRGSFKESQRRALMNITKASFKVVVMSRRGAGILKNIYGVPQEKIAFIPHGVPDLSNADVEWYKRKLGFEGRRLILTFGLMRPEKGIELGIRALTEAVKEDPSLLYVILGTTHPELKRREGEEYRLFLQRLVKDLYLSDHVLFVDRFVDESQLHEYLCATDFYLTPYLKKEQITSGALAFALGAGKAIISTPYWYAEELLSDGRGLLVPFGDYEAISDALVKLLRQPSDRLSMSRRAYRFGRKMLWSRVGADYWNLFQQAFVPSDIGRKKIA
jgi:glycosyltransferase involved in cell wall biosynthesis